MEIPIIAKLILETAWKELIDADYENHARVLIGDDFELLDQRDYEELKKFLLSNCVLSQRLKERTFEDVVTIKEIDFGLR
jgi:hypothetical protein